jgi:hypothetical protein
MDATVVETEKEDALFSYKGYKAYQPHNVWWAEQELVLHWRVQGRQRPRRL